MKILMYGWEFPPHISGGLGVACHGIVTGLCEHDINISLVLPCVIENSFESDHVRFYDCRKNMTQFSMDSLKRLNQVIQLDSINTWLTPYITAKSHENFFNNQSIKNKYTTVFDQESFYHFQGDYGVNLLDEVIRYAVIAGHHAHHVPHDIIHAHDWLTILAGVEAKNISGKPLIFHVHALETDRNDQNVNQTIFDIEMYGMQQADKVIAVSQYTKDCIIKNYNISPHKIKVAHNGIFKEQIDFTKQQIKMPKNKNIVLFLGRVTQQKGPFYFLKAAQKILEVRQDIEFVLAGDGDLWKSMIHQVASWRLGSHIHFTKFLSKSFAKEIFQRSKVFVMPSISEPFGLACLEAVGKHVPVILSKQSGVSEVMNYCHTVDFWDTDKIAEYIVQLIDNSVLSKYITENSFMQLSNLLWNEQVKKIIETYSEVTPG